jgi:pantetheine-phosphate adenylyltransferase
MATRPSPSTAGPQALPSEPPPSGAPPTQGSGASNLVAIYPGSFDPITNGHVDIIRRALHLFDKVIVAIAENVRKQPLFSIAERADMIRDSVGHDPRVEVDAFSGLLVDYARRRGARVLIRGLRAIADFEYEFQFAHMNRHLAPDVETVFLMTSEVSFYVSSSLVKEVAAMGGDITRIAPTAVVEALKKKIKSGDKNSDKHSDGTSR